MLCIEMTGIIYFIVLKGTAQNCTEFLHDNITAKTRNLDLIACYKTCPNGSYHFIFMREIL